MSKVYICTAIPYVNGVPHIGHAIDYLQADAYARFRRSLGDEVRFQVGTDEHGNKVFSSALKNHLSVETYAAQNSQVFQDFINKLNISYTDTIRTTNPDHMRRCQAIWQKLEPHIYSAEYDGWYCEGCENFVTEKEYTENHGVCPDHQKPYIHLSEKNYYLRISDFKSEIKRHIENDDLQILPEFRKREILKLLEDTPDISISRPKGSLSWGVPVPGDDSQVMYVWLDALSNYITILGYPDQDISDFWPATAQFIGKDILRFHAITWPAILLGLGLPLPERLVVHGHILSSGQKMSKSLGNVVNPLEIIDRHGVEAFRYFFLRHVDTFLDSDFTYDKFDQAYANELANDLGNLVQRLATLCSKNHIAGIPLESLSSQSDLRSKNELQKTEFEPGKSEFTPSSLESSIFPPEYLSLMENFEFSKAFDFAWTRIQALNKSIDQAKPWELAKQGRTAEVVEVLGGLVHEMLLAAQLLVPFLPNTANRILTIFTTTETITPPESPLFPKG